MTDMDIGAITQWFYINISKWTTAKTKGDQYYESLWHEWWYYFNNVDGASDLGKRLCPYHFNWGADLSHGHFDYQAMFWAHYYLFVWSNYL